MAEIFYPVRNRRADMTARQNIERRLGYAWPPTRDLAPDQRAAIKGLAVQLIKRRKENANRNLDHAGSFNRLCGDAKGPQFLGMAVDRRGIRRVRFGRGACE